MKRLFLFFIFYFYSCTFQYSIKSKVYFILFLLSINLIVIFRKAIKLIAIYSIKSTLVLN